ncbi:hypothetical protein RN001_014832 [Aquatica leii]|uniref:Uncharacterized protein n=1 Tax=Aquatica leii TaxID=1421715 RepID=A0AAN7SKT0_9COLE|nr:hypothetical protein RN001_014832 [Aquatica leii]
MPQGKLKVKSKLPAAVKSKKGKGKAMTQRANHPIKPKKQMLQETQKMKRVVTKNVNKAVEDEMRSRAYDGQKKKLSKAQEAVAAYHNEQESGTSNT